jgi:hypothetical protein
MKTYILYTTSKSKRVQEQADIFASELSRTKGRGEVKIKVVTNKLPKSPKMVLRSDGYYMPSWEWFKAIMPHDGYDGIIFHFSTYYRSKWGIKSPKNTVIGGSRNPVSKDYPMFWVCDDLSEESAKGYENERIYDTDIVVTDFLRKLFHEHAHYDEDVDDMVGDNLNQYSVHHTDYDLKKIHLYHYMVDYRGKDLKEQVAKVIASVFKLVKKYV